MEKNYTNVFGNQIEIILQSYTYYGVKMFSCLNQESDSKSKVQTFK